MCVAGSNGVVASVIEWSDCSFVISKSFLFQLYYVMFHHSWV